ncbi:MAG: dephospho-CoA kinase [Desulfobacteraceae bacterium]
MLKIALTGGAASGKSTVAEFLRDLGVPVIDVDELAREAVAPGQPAAQEIREAFGAEFFQADGTLDREKLARQVFAHPADRHRLNDLVHPWIRQEINRRLHQFEARGEPVVVVEVPLLFELGLESAYDLVAVVYTDRQTQIQRLQHRDRRDRAQIEGMLEAQTPLEDKIRRADYLIDNRGSIQELHQQVKKFLNEIKPIILDKKN